MEIDNSWLTEEYLDSLGYYKIKDTGQYGEYQSKHCIANSLTYGLIPKDYRKLTFNRDSKYGVFIGIRSDWDTRYSIQNALAVNKETFEILLNSAV